MFGLVFTCLDPPPKAGRAVICYAPEAVLRALLSALEAAQARGRPAEARLVARCILARAPPAELSDCLQRWWQHRLRDRPKPPVAALHRVSTELLTLAF